MIHKLLRALFSHTLLFLFLPYTIFAQVDTHTGEVLIKYSSNITGAQKNKIRKTIGKKRQLSSVFTYHDSGAFSSYSHTIERFQLAPGVEFKTWLNSSAISSLIQTGLILDIEPNYSFAMSALPNDPELLQQWGLANTGQNNGNIGADIQASQAWNLQTSGEGVVGIIDTGIDFAHPDLVENIWQNLAEDADGDGRVIELINGVWQLDPDDLDSTDADGNGYIDDLIGWDFVNNDNNPFDDNGHGTHIAGIIGAKGNNGKGISGVCWSTQMMALKAFNKWGQGSLSDILPALAYARNMGVVLTNNSWGGSRYSRFLKEEITRGKDEGQIFVAAAGNTGYDNPNRPIYPANYTVENIISVCASTENDELARFSSYDRREVDLAAPGQRIYSTLPEGRYGAKSGTSMATGFVSGAVLLLSAHAPSLSMDEIISRILLNASPKQTLYDKCRTGGRLDIFAILQNSVIQPSTSGLFANIRGPVRGCVNMPIQFINTSIIPNLGQTNVSWFINGIGVSNDFDLTYSFANPGFYELKLVLQEGGDREELIRPIEITPVASTVDLGSDTSLCASNYVLQTSSTFSNIRWLKLQCPSNTNCLGAEDFTTQDSLTFNTQGGNTAEFGSSFVLTDTFNQILETSNQLLFSPQPAGTYRMHAIYHWLEITPSGLQVGNNITDIDLGIDTCGQILPPHEFRVIEAELIGREPYVGVSTSGLYVLEVMDACGNRTSDAIALTLTPGCVWPGDINDDGKVSMLDFLSLGIAQGQTGRQRPNASPNWTGQAAPDWATAFDSANVLAPALNHKYADANGDGLVDLSLDKQVVKDNLGFFHDVDIPDTGEGPSFYIEHLNTLYSLDGDTAEIEIAMFLEGPRESDVQDFFWHAFNLNFSDPILEEPLLTPSQDWLGPMEQMTLFTDASQNGFGAQFLPIDRRKAGFGMVSSNGRSYTGRGQLAGGIIIVTIDDVADDSTGLGFSSFSITSEHVVLVDSLGRAISSPVINNLNTLTLELNWENPSCEALQSLDSDLDAVCDVFDICPGYDDFLYPREGLLQWTDEGNAYTCRRVHFLNNKIITSSYGSNPINLDLMAIAFEGDSNYLAMVNDGTGSPANYRLRLLDNGYFSTSLLNTENRFTSVRFADRILGMAQYDTSNYLILYKNSSQVQVFTSELTQSGSFTNNRFRTSVSGLPPNTLAIARKSEGVYHVLVQDGGRFPALYLATLQNDWSFTLSLLDSEVRLSKAAQDIAFVEGRDCPTCQSNCQFSFTAKMMLEGSYDSSSGLMDDTYRTENLLSFTDPFGLNTQLDATLLIPENEDAIVDWIKVQLHAADDATQIITEKAVLLKRNGELVDPTGNPSLLFEGINNASYYVSIKHSSHLGVMTAAPQSFNSNPFLDFSSPGTPVFSLGGQAMKIDNGIRLLWAGDANGDGKINAIDKNLFWLPENGSSFIYGSSKADLNMDGLINAIDLNFYWRDNNSLIEQIP